MRTYYTLNERTVHRPFKKHRRPRRSLFVFDRDLRAFGLKITPTGKRTFFVRIINKLGRFDIELGTVGTITAAEARARALDKLKQARHESNAGPLMRDYAEEFLKRTEHRWKPATRHTNRDAIANRILPYFGEMRVPDIGPTDVHRWFDSMSRKPATANRTLPVLSVMMTQAELWDIRPAGSNPCRNMRRFRMKPRERFLSVDELKRLGGVLDSTDDTQGAAAVRLLLFTGARSSEITGLRWDWIRGTRAVLPDSKTGPKTIQLPPPARAVLGNLPRDGEFVFPHPRGSGPVRDLGRRWSKLRIQAGLDDVRLHDLRHTYASHAVMSGLDLYTVGRLLGHADIASTERYAHLADEHVVKAAGRIDRIVGDAMKGETETNDAD